MVTVMADDIMSRIVDWEEAWLGGLAWPFTI